MRSVTIITMFVFACFLSNKFDPNVEEFGKIWDFESFDFNMYWPLLNLYSDNFAFGPGGF